MYTLHPRGSDASTRIMENTEETSEVPAQLSCWRIRAASPGDIPAILQLIKDLAVYEKEPESVVEINEQVLQKDCFGEERWFECLVAEEYDKNHLKPEGQGIGKTFLKELAKIAIHKGCCKIKWHVLDWNKLAINFYDSIGTDIEGEWRLCCLGTTAMMELSGKAGN
ncbi:thialysine N-epsilon-acetyltransferase isoform X2 [Nematostella vectensis]|uniref:thialysine N-epsilon-acetyltransferase isoform X2 n=1 Tax=Nematostella vectensis TaxID=45351 RepID=UPI0020776C21|nr:thialysine N-epsilon-acetyltransferase isoform X2 [Nematostella vectensis]